MRLPLQIGLAVGAPRERRECPGSDAFSGDGPQQRRHDHARANGGATIARSAIRTGTATACSRATKSGAGAQRQNNWSQDWNRDGRVDNFDAQIAQRFRGYDMDNDNRVAAASGLATGGCSHVSTPTATAISRYRNTRRAAGSASTHWADRRSASRTRREQGRLGHPQRMAHGQRRLQSSRHQPRQPDQPLRVRERRRRATTTGHRPRSSTRIDVNRDGWLTRPESRMTNAEFDRLDTNNDNRISRFEFENERRRRFGRRHSARSAAWRTGYDRGIQEGRVAGREDSVRTRRWDLEGQTRVRTGRLGLHAASRIAQRLSGGISRRVPERVSRRFYNAATTVARQRRMANGRWQMAERLSAISHLRSALT